MALGRDIVKWATRRLLGWDLMRVAEEAYALVPAARPGTAWFSLKVQRELLFKRAGVDLVIDVGANTGQFGAALRQSYDGEIVSFEPSSAAFPALEDRCRRDGRWRAVKCALGSSAATMELRLAELSVLNSFLPRTSVSEERFGRRSAQTDHEAVPVRRFEDAVEDASPGTPQRRMFVKIDTQGFDLEVARGFGRLRPQIVGLQSEVSIRGLYSGAPDWLTSLREYQEQGFGVVGLYPAVLDHRGYPMEFDCLMARDQS